MKLLRSRTGFLRWAEKVAGATTRQDGDWDTKRKKPLKILIPEPVEYPCFAYAVCASFGYEEEAPEYLYEADVLRMWKEIRDAGG